MKFVPEMRHSVDTVGAREHLQSSQLYISSASTMTKKRTKQAAPHKSRDPFRIVTSETARMGRTAKGIFSTHRAHADINLAELSESLTEKQSEEICNIYKNNLHKDYSYRFLDDSQQVSAQSLLSQLGLDTETLTSVQSRYAIRWSKVVGKGDSREKRYLYSWYVNHSCLITYILTITPDSDCGYNHQAAGSDIRHNQWEFTGCLAHVEVVWHIKTSKVLRIRGYFEHNEGCRQAKCVNKPDLPLHPSVFDASLKMLLQGHTYESVIAKNETQYDKRAYPDMPQQDEGILKSRYRWLLETKDHRTLFRKLDRARGVDVTQEAHINIDEWLNHSSPSYNANLAASVFHYEPRRTKDDRFELCIATKEMRDAAWVYGNKKQLILDGTFGVSKAKVLLFIAMAIDNNGKGIPLAFFLFSAPSENKHTPAGYDTSILTKLLKIWKNSLEAEVGNDFSCLVAITDTDTKERKALTLTFSDIYLLICRFHIRQSWQNHRSKSVLGQTSAHSAIRARLARIEDELLATTIYEDACAIIKRESTAMEQLSRTEDEILALGALKHIHYLSSYWLSSEAIWKSWSDRGREDAAALLNCPVSSVVGTTNHLESFNGLLKNRKLQQHKRFGRRLRLDVLIKVLINNTLPSIFRRKRLARQEQNLIEKRIRSLPGGEELVSKPSNVLDSIPVAYLQPDQGRDTAAQSLLSNKQIGSPEFINNSFTFECYSSLALSNESAPTVYKISMQLNGQASCTCKDFQHRGGACKHMRAALLRLNQIRSSSENISIPIVQLPSTEIDARQLISALQAAPTTCDPVQETISAIDCLILEDGDAIFEDDSEDEDNGLTQHSSTKPMEPEKPISLYFQASHNEYDIPVLRGTAKLGVDDQSVARVLRDLEYVTPKLHDLVGFLDGVHLHSEFIPRAQACRSAIQPVVEALDRLLQQTTFKDTMDVEEILPRADFRLQKSNSASTSQTTTKRRREDILPPSPEKGSAKRHQSYSVN